MVLTVLITLVQGGGYLAYLQQQGAISAQIQILPTSIFWISNMIILSTGTIFAMWLGRENYG